MGNRRCYRHQCLMACGTCRFWPGMRQEGKYDKHDRHTGGAHCDPLAATSIGAVRVSTEPTRGSSTTAAPGCFRWQLKRRSPWRVWPVARQAGRVCRAHSRDRCASPPVPHGCRRPHAAWARVHGARSVFPRAGWPSPRARSQGSNPWQTQVVVLGIFRSSCIFLWT